MTRSTEKMAAPAWATGFLKFWRRFCNSFKAVWDIIGNMGGSVINGITYLTEALFDVVSSKLNPIFAAKVFIFFASSVIVWGLWSWWQIGSKLLGLMGSNETLGGFIGLAIGTVLNFFEIVPELGLLFQEYADVYGASGKEEEAQKYDRWSITAKNFTKASLSRLEAWRNLSLVGELLATFGYQWIIGGFTRTVTKQVKGSVVKVFQMAPFWEVVGAVTWCIAVVKLPEFTLKGAAAAIHVAVNVAAERNSH